MTTLAAALSDSATEMRVNAADADPAPYYQIDSEVVRLLANSTTIQDGFSPSRTLDMTLWQIERGDAATTPASHLSGATVSPLWPQVAGDGAGLTQDLEDALTGAYQPSATNVFTTREDIPLYSVLLAGTDAGGEFAITGLLDPTDPQDAATKAYADTAIAARTFAEILLGSAPPESPQSADGNDTGGVEIRHDPTVDVMAQATLTAAATGSGNARTRALAQVVDGDAEAGPRGEASGDGNVDACAYARTVDGDALADNDAAATGTGLADAGGYAASFDGTAFTGGIATATGSGNADASDNAVANTGTATAGFTATRGAAVIGLVATSGDGVLQMIATGLPTANPVLAGALWNDAGTLKISAG